MKPSDPAGGPGLRSHRPLARYFAIIVGLAATLGLAGTTAGSDEITVSGALSPFLGNQSAGPDGTGLAVLTISGDRAQVAWTITYRGVSSPITDVYFCAGSNPPQYPIGDPCAFVMPKAVGGSSPITGSGALLAEQADRLSSGSVFVELDSAVGPQLAGYVRVGPPVPNMATVEGPSSGDPPAQVPVAIIAAIGTFVYVLAFGPRRRGAAGSPAPRGRFPSCSVGRPGRS